MKIKLVQVHKVVLFVVIFSILIYAITYYNEIRLKEETTKIDFKGIISAKYIDKSDHNRPKIEIKSSTKTIVYDLENEKSGLFEYVNKGDSIEKLSNSVSVHIFSLSKDTILKLDF